MAEDPSINPYAPPGTNVDASVEGEIFSEFPRFSTWGVLGLSIVTLSMYFPYWMYTRTAILNRLLPHNPVPGALMGTGAALYVVNMGMAVLDGIYGNLDAVSGVSTILNLVSTIVFLVWVFKFRNRIHQLARAIPGTRGWLGALRTFFLQVLYFQYKLNQLIDAEVEGAATRAVPGATQQAPFGSGRIV
jgi:hypothetical protein